MITWLYNIKFVWFVLRAYIMNTPCVTTHRDENNIFLLLLMRHLQIMTKFRRHEKCFTLLYSADLNFKIQILISYNTYNMAWIQCKHG